MREYADLGIDTFILSGYPDLEVLGCQVVRLGRATEVQRRMRCLHRRIQQLRSGHSLVLAFEIHDLARDQVAARQALRLRGAPAKRYVPEPIAPVSLTSHS